MDNWTDEEIDLYLRRYGYATPDQGETDYPPRIGLVFTD